MPTTIMDRNSIAFLDTNSTVNEFGKVKVRVYRKVSHTIKYFAFPFTQPSERQKICCYYLNGPC